MRYVIAVDGGGTKTLCLLGNDKGEIIVQLKGGASNHNIVGGSGTFQVLQELITGTLKQANLSLQDIGFAYFGLSGADTPGDFKLLESLINPIVKDIPFKIVNDCWIALSSGSPSGWGAVSICGTGASAAARNPEGAEFIHRNLSYELGNFNGGRQLAAMALHSAFRADEGTGPDTALRTEIPGFLNKSSMDELASHIWNKKQDRKELLKLPPLVFSLANSGDEVCKDILIKMGKKLGQSLGGIIVKAGMKNLKVPVVLAGSLYEGENPLMVDALLLNLHRMVPGAYLIKPENPPVIGAYREALRMLDI